MFKNLTGSISTFIDSITPADTTNEETCKDDKKTESSVATDKEVVADPDGSSDPVAAEKPAVTDDNAPAGEEVGENKGDEPSGTTTQEKDVSTETMHNIQDDIDEVSAKAMKTAKEWGSYLYTFGKSAGEQVTSAASIIKDQVQERTIIGDFSAENKKFIDANLEKKNKKEASVVPWAGFQEEESIKKQILSLSQDSRNFLRNPPEGVPFHFDFDSSFPVAMAILEIDADLRKMRFDLVPKQIKEQIFWRNYFYRVSLVKQSTQLTQLATESNTINERASSFKEEEKTVESPDITELRSNLAESLSHDQDEFVSDTFIDDDNIETTANEEEPEWERELAAELNEFEIVVDENTEGLDEDLEREILQEMHNDQEKEKK